MPKDLQQTNTSASNSAVTAAVIAFMNDIQSRCEAGKNQAFPNLANYLGAMTLSLAFPNTAAKQSHETPATALGETHVPVVLPVEASVVVPHTITTGEHAAVIASHEVAVSHHSLNTATLEHPTNLAQEVNAVVANAHVKASGHGDVGASLFKGAAYNTLNTVVSAPLSRAATLEREGRPRSEAFKNPYQGAGFSYTIKMFRLGASFTTLEILSSRFAHSLRQYTNLSPDAVDKVATTAAGIVSGGVVEAIVFGPAENIVFGLQSGRIPSVRAITLEHLAQTGKGLGWYSARNMTYMGLWPTVQSVSNTAYARLTGKQGNSVDKVVTTGVFSGLVCTTLGLPFHNAGAAVARGAASSGVEFIRNTLQKEGAKGLFKGGAPALVGAAIGGVVYSTVTEYAPDAYQSIRRGIDSLTRPAASVAPLSPLVSVANALANVPAPRVDIEHLSLI